MIFVILENPSMYLSEICDDVEQFSGVKVKEATICRLLKRHGLTRKKENLSCSIAKVCHFEGLFHGLSNSVQKRTICVGGRDWI